MIIPLTKDSLPPFKANFHTHSDFCDGKNTLAEMAKAAFEKGFTHLGFSSHAIFPFAGFWHIPLDKYQTYQDEINRLKDDYKGRMEIFMGFEADWLPPAAAPKKNMYSKWKPDYLIGSVHYVSSPKGLASVDHRTEMVKKGIDLIFDGDGRKMVQAYFEAERSMLETCSFDILAHPDLVRKRNSELSFFDETEEWYKKELELTANAIAKAKVIVEINTGAIVRGSMNDVYPSATFLSMLKERNVPICINSDAHTIQNIDGAFERGVEAALKAGYTELTYPC